MFCTITFLQSLLSLTWVLIKPTHFKGWIVLNIYTFEYLIKFVFFFIIVKNLPCLMSAFAFTGLKFSGCRVCVGYREQEWLRTGCHNHVYHGQWIRPQGGKMWRSLEWTIPLGKRGRVSVRGFASPLLSGEPVHTVYGISRTGDTPY